MYFYFFSFVIWLTLFPLPPIPFLFFVSSFLFFKTICGRCDTWCLFLHTPHRTTKVPSYERWTGHSQPCLYCRIWVTKLAKCTWSAHLNKAALIKTLAEESGIVAERLRSLLSRAEPEGHFYWGQNICHFVKA